MSMKIHQARPSTATMRMDHSGMNASAACIEDHLRSPQSLRAMLTSNNTGGPLPNAHTTLTNTEAESAVVPPCSSETMDDSRRSVSNLSFRDVYIEEQLMTVSPSSHAAPSLGIADSMDKLNLKASASVLSLETIGSGLIPPLQISSTPQKPPVLYSAIGSLEDPTNSYPKKAEAKKKKVVEFPSCALVPPLDELKRRHNKLKTQPTATTEDMPNDSKKSSLTETLKNSPPTEEQPDAPTTSTELSKKQPSTPSNLRTGASSEAKKGQTAKVKLSLEARKRKKRKGKGPIEMFRPSSDAYTPRMGKRELKYKPTEMRTPVQKMASPLGSISRPNVQDALCRVAMIIRKHIVKIESRFEQKNHAESKKSDGLFSDSMRDSFSEESFVTPKYRCTMVRVPMARPGMVFGLKHVRQDYTIPAESEIYEFAKQLIDTVQLSSECSIVCLIYVERLMEQAKVPLLACTWRPVFMCGLLLASKVWQDLGSWNVEFASVYPQFSLDAINRLELQFLRHVKWDLYISSSLYAKYFFALRSFVEKPDFRNRYHHMVGIFENEHASDARKVQERSSQVEKEVLNQLSRSV